MACAVAVNRSGRRSGNPGATHRRNDVFQKMLRATNNIFRPMIRLAAHALRAPFLKSDHGLLFSDYLKIKSFYRNGK